MAVILSVIIPTHNRSADLAEVLASLLAQGAGEAIEIIVVDSASDARAAERLAAVTAAAPGVRLLRLERPGVSLARNLGVAAARGPWLGFLDDDVIPASNWVGAALGRIRHCDDTVGVIGGRVLPLWPPARGAARFRPDTLGPRARILLSVIDDQRTYCSSASPLGISANLLIRRSALQAIGGFPVDMGRVGRSLASGEDPYVIDRIAAHGWQTWFDGAIRVDHKIHADQLTWRWMARRGWHEGFVGLRKSRSPTQRLAMAAKGLAGVPVLAVMLAVAGARADVIVRLCHNLGFACGTLLLLLGGTRLRVFREPLAPQPYRAKPR